MLRGRRRSSLDAEISGPWRGELRAAGVRRVRRSSWIRRYFDDDFVPPAFEQQPSEWAPFRAPVAAVSLDENTVRSPIRPTKDGEDASVDVDPPGFVDVDGQRWNAKKGDPEKVDPRASSRRATRSSRKLGGTSPEEVALAAGGEARRRSAPARGLRAAGGARSSSASRSPAEVKLGGAKAETPARVAPIRAARRQLCALGKDSDNFYAEMLFKAIGAETKGRPATAEAAASVVTAYLEGARRLRAGRGREERLGPLRCQPRHARGDHRAPPRRVSRSARSGPSSSPSSRSAASTARCAAASASWRSRAVRAKTGTLDAVAALSGYVLRRPGRAPVAFAILVNGIPGKVGAARRGIDSMVEAAAPRLWKDDNSRAGLLSSRTRRRGDRAAYP